MVVGKCVALEREEPWGAYRDTQWTKFDKFVQSSKFPFTLFSTIWYHKISTLSSTNFLIIWKRCKFHWIDLHCLCSMFLNLQQLLNISQVQILASIIGSVHKNHSKCQNNALWLVLFGFIFSQPIQQGNLTFKHDVCPQFLNKK